MIYDLKSKNKKRERQGFTLVELLVVISIMGVLTVISLASFKNAQVKARDVQRKSDLKNVASALMLYFNDKGLFPNEPFPFGNVTVGFTGDNSIVYMRQTPSDPKNNGSNIYVYKVDPVNKKYFNLFANLENEKDSQCLSVPYTVGGVSYCYGISSPNSVVKNW